jgi:hypothetical protein
MKYAIIGSGKIGTALVRTFARKNIEVAIAKSCGPKMLPFLKGELSPRFSSIYSRRRTAHPFMLGAGNLAGLCFGIWLSSSADSSSHFWACSFANTTGEADRS